MSIIIYYKTDKGVYLGSDINAETLYGIYEYGYMKPKWEHFYCADTHNDFWFGATGDACKIGHIEELIMDEVFKDTVYIPTIRGIMEKHREYHKQISTSPDDGRYLFYFPKIDELYTYDDYTMHKLNTDYRCEGSGKEAALGSIETSILIGVDDDKIVDYALESCNSVYSNIQGKWVKFLEKEL